MIEYARLNRLQIEQRVADADGCLSPAERSVRRAPSQGLTHGVFRDSPAGGRLGPEDDAIAGDPCEDQVRCDAVLGLIALVGGDGPAVGDERCNDGGMIAIVCGHPDLLAPRCPPCPAHPWPGAPSVSGESNIVAKGDDLVSIRGGVPALMSKPRPWPRALFHLPGN